MDRADKIDFVEKEFILTRIQRNSSTKFLNSKLKTLE